MSDKQLYYAMDTVEHQPVSEVMETDSSRNDVILTEMPEEPSTESHYVHPGLLEAVGSSTSTAPAEEGGGNVVLMQEADLNLTDVEASQGAEQCAIALVPSESENAIPQVDAIEQGRGLNSLGNDKSAARLERHQVAGIKAALTPMSPLIAAAANCKEPTPTKSLPSKMERMQSLNSIAPQKKKSELPQKMPLQTHIRQQNSTPRPTSVYNCQKCTFRTSRIQNLVLHKKKECAFVKDFFSWDANTFIEVAKKKEASPSDIVENVVSTMTVTTPTKRKSRPRQRPDVPAKVARMEAVGKKRSSTQVKGRPVGTAQEESSDSDAQPISSAEGISTDIEFSEDDVVWVGWKRLHWPALVLKVFPITRKAKVFLIDSIASKETVVVNMKKMFNFNSAERNKHFLNEGLVGRNSGALVKATQKAEEFLRKRCFGIYVNPRQFFCSREVELIRDYSEDSGHSDRSYKDSVRSVRSVSPPSSDDLKKVEAIKQGRKRRNERLVDCIKAKEVDDHLFGVLNGTIPSERHRKFNTKLQSDRLWLKHQSWFGPIDDSEQQEEICLYCIGLLKEMPTLDEDFDITGYAFEVWCPEAVTKALSRTRRISWEDAEKIFNKAVVLSKVEHEVIHRQMMAPLPTSEDCEEDEEHYRCEYLDKGIEDAVLEVLNC